MLPLRALPFALCCFLKLLKWNSTPNDLPPNISCCFGDNLHADIRYGIHTCWYNPQQLPNDSNAQPTYRIAVLIRLKDVLNDNKLS